MLVGDLPCRVSRSAMNPVTPARVDAPCMLQHLRDRMGDVPTGGTGNRVLAWLTH